jgi:queuine/archaeosine tRNA-ribosyltransferase
MRKERWRRCPMRLELSHQEVVDLQEALHSYVREFHDEVTHTDDRELRAEFRRTLQRMDELRQKLDRLVEADQSPTWA